MQRDRIDRAPNPFRAWVRQRAREAAQRLRQQVKHGAAPAKGAAAIVALQEELAADLEAKGFPREEAASVALRVARRAVEEASADAA